MLYSLAVMSFGPEMIAEVTEFPDIRRTWERLDTTLQSLRASGYVRHWENSYGYPLDMGNDIYLWLNLRQNHGYDDEGRDQYSDSPPEWHISSAAEEVAVFTGGQRQESQERVMEQWVNHVIATLPHEKAEWVKKAWLATVCFGEPDTPDHAELRGSAPATLAAEATVTTTTILKREREGGYELDFNWLETQHPDGQTEAICGLTLVTPQGMSSYGRTVKGEETLCSLDQEFSWNREDGVRFGAQTLNRHVTSILSEISKFQLPATAT